MFRVINEDLSYEDLDVIDEFETIEEAIQCEADNYVFNTSVEQLIDGKWELVAINGMLLDKIQSI